jgi:YHS domain-containing protein
MRYLEIKGMVLFVLALTVLLIPNPAPAKDLLNKTSDDLAIKGYDPVAYFTMGKPVKGSPELQYEWIGAFWRFMSLEHRTMFEAAPEKYAPKFGGYCSYGVATGKVLDIDPEAWKIEDGKLYLFHTKKIRELWLGDPSVFLEEAATNWIKLQGE